MVLVQSVECSPMVHLFNDGQLPEHYAPKSSAALGLAVPYPFAICLLDIPFLCIISTCLILLMSVITPAITPLYLSLSLTQR